MQHLSHAKIIAKPGTWFKAGTEVRIAYEPEPYPRVTFEKLYEYIKESPIAVFCGTRITEHENEGGWAIGEEHLDEETCGWDEFTFELVSPLEEV